MAHSSATSPAERAVAEVVRAAPGRFAGRGRLTFATARKASEAGLRAFAAESGPAIEVDLSGVSSGDSAGLAVLLQWLGWGRRRGVAISFSQVPDSIRAMARISEVESILLRDASASAPAQPQPPPTR